MVKYRRIIYYLSRGIRSGLFYAPFLLFAILLSLSFFAFPAAEDLSIHYYDNLLGAGESISRFYHGDSSRYFSFPAIFLLFKGRYFLEHYWLVTLILFAGLWSILYFLVSAVSGLLLTAGISRKWSAWVSMVLLLAISSTLFQMAGVFYWVSGAMTYLLSFILYILLMILVGSAAEKGRMKAATLFSTALLAFLTTGTNEITLFFLTATLLWIQAICLSIGKRPLRSVNLLLLVILACFVFLIIPGGTSHRAGHFRLNHSIWQGVLIAGGYTGLLFSRLMAYPMVWLCMALAGYAGLATREDIRARLSGSFFFNPLVILLFLVTGLAFFYFIVYIFSGELLPPRANDLMLFYILLFMLIASYAYALRSGGSAVFMRDLFGRDQVKGLVLLIFISSRLFYGGLQSLVVGYIYKGVMEKRKREMAATVQKGMHKVVLHSYGDDFNTVSGMLLPSSLSSHFSRGEGKYPQLIFYQDPLADTGLYIHYYAEYHHIDTISYGGADYERIGLMIK